VAKSYESLDSLIQPDHIIELNVSDKDAALRVMCESLTSDPRILDAGAFLNAIMERERQASTGVGLGVAIPHVKIPQVTDYVMVVGRSKTGVEFQSIDGKPVQLIFMIGASDRQTRDFVKILRDVTHLIKHDDTRQALLDAEIPGGFYRLLNEHGA
jgi:mannitol/fructose-specific phosphotransferase system IIA component (Ntr-type)